ncbi:DEAD/DEAH box helicase [Streptomyces sp. NPDC056347]|uniref:DEAD/DEAH box helicase n=1 Tax=Streptomyces sp. NPDC056347 TaxID=3345790 RepID=UPI0035E14747
MDHDHDSTTHSTDHNSPDAGARSENSVRNTVTDASPVTDTSPVTDVGPVTDAGPVTEFAELPLPAALLPVLAGEGITTPFPVQAATLPSALAGRDVLGRGRTGSGKTLAFGLAVLARTAGSRAESRRPLALVLVPTRELAQQVTEALAPYARALRLRLATLYGGVPVAPQAAALREGAEVVVATPGRLRDLVERRSCRLDRVAVTVLDEADRMADMGFLPQVTAVLDLVRPQGQRLLFSATLDSDVDELVRRYLHDPVVHSADPVAGAVAATEHHLLLVRPADKFTVATRIAARDGRVILFLHTKHAADRFAAHLLGSGVRAAALHGGKSQQERTRTLERFRAGQITALVATDVAARGIHVDELDLVVNVDPPGDHKDYLHRGGRTSRAGASGTVVTLALPTERRETVRLMAEAGITPLTTRVHPGDAELSRITGAREPSGVPVDGAAPTRERTGAGGGGGNGGGGGGAPFRGLGSRPAKPGRSRRADLPTAQARAAAKQRRANRSG